MLFSETVFLFAFLPVTLAVYYLLSRVTPLKNAWLLLASLVFYAWGEPRFVLVMMASVVMSYLCGLLIGCDTPWIRKIGFTVGCVLNFGLLFVYKYLGFVASVTGGIFRVTLPIPELTLPIGISFFTFQSVSYLADVYRGRCAVQKNPVNHALYVALFPQLIAGPIVRYETVADEIVNRRETARDFCEGFCRFAWGLSKKVLLANQMGIIADTAFSANGEGTLSTALAWLGAFAYALQIYYDFSGYSDMAIGLGRMLGFHFPENFNYPYISKSITEFWRRWHISLGTWFRDYVYIPLGGSRVGGVRLVWNLAVVWIFTGIWHGASWNFLFWGVWFFVLLTVEKLVLSRILPKEEPMPFWKSFLLWMGAMLCVLLGWVLFRAETLPLALSYLRTMLIPTVTDSTALMMLSEKRWYILVACVCCIPIIPWAEHRLDMCRGGRLRALPLLWDCLYPVICVGTFLVSVAYLVKLDYNPFIYFHF